MNSDTIVSLFGGTGRNQIPLQTLAATTETLVLVNSVTDGASPVTTTSAALVKIPLQTDIRGASSPNQYHGINPSMSMPQLGRSDPFANAAAPYFTSDSFDGRPFQFVVRGTGAAVANAGNTLILAMYQGTSSTIGSDHKIAANSALATASAASFNFLMSADLIWDSASQSLGGVFEQLINYNGTSTLASRTAVTSQASITIGLLSFGFSVKWGNAAGGTCQVTEMGLNLL